MFGKVPVVPAGSFLSKIRDTIADTCHIQPVSNKDLDLCQKLFCIYGMLLITSKWKVFRLPIFAVDPTDFVHNSRKICEGHLKKYVCFICNVRKLCS